MGNDQMFTDNPAHRVIRSVREQVVDQLREEILSGQMPAGARVSEAHLAKHFGVSRGPIREALAQLTHEGLFISKPNCGVTVAPEPSDHIRGLVLPVRRTIETYALGLFFDQINERDFRVWDEILYRYERAYRDRDEEAIVLQHIAFHRSIIERAGDPELLAIWQAILVRVRGHFRKREHLYGEYADGQPVDKIAEHRQLVESFRSGDKSAAIQALETHIC
jgi:DNA-binding GntR family transcriptional regulator